MQIVVLVSFVVALTLVHPPMLSRLMPSGWPAAAALAAYLCGAGLLTRLHAVLGVRALGQWGEVPAAWRRRHGLLVVATQCWLIAGLGALIAMGYGRWVMEELALERVALLGKLAVLAPFFVAVLLTWLLDYPFYRATRRRIAEQELLTGVVLRRPWTLGQYIAYNVRHHLLFIAVPVGLIVLLSDVLQLYVSPLLPEGAGYVVLGLMVASAASVFLLAPLIVVRIWRTRSLPSGPIRRELDDACRAMNLHCRDILVWDSGHAIANAGVMGLVPSLRYVLLSDALLEQMTPAQIKSIFAHEAGHVVCRHILYAAVFAISSVLLCGAVGEALAQGFRWPSWLTETVILLLLGVTWAWGFGWISRRFERQSDVIAAWASGQRRADDDPGRITQEGAAAFAQALERVGQLNGIPPRQRNWRHGSIAHRVSYVLWLASVGGSRRGIDRAVRRIKLGLWLALAVALAVTAWQMVVYG